MTWNLADPTGEEDVELADADDEKVDVGGAVELLPEVLEDEVVRGVAAGGDLVAAELLRA